MVIRRLPGTDGRYLVASGAKCKSLRESLPPLLPALRSYARALCRDRNAADDLLQETVLRALAAEAQWQADTNLRAWLFTIQRNAWLGGLRRRGVERRYLDSVASEGSVSQPDHGSVRDLNQALQALPAVQREALTLVGGQGMSLVEAAAVCGVAVGTMKARMSRGRAALRRLVEGPD